MKTMNTPSKVEETLIIFAQTPKLVIYRVVSK
jgi:hypothetical protein